MKKFKIALAISMIAILSSCDDRPSADQIDKNRQDVLLQEASKQVGIPNIVNFTEKKLLKTALELRDNPNMINYEYVFSEGTGKYTYLGRCVGFGIPYSTEYTNPQKIVYSGNGNYTTLPQADPNGLFAPSSSEGTIIAEYDSKTKDIKIAYIEERIHVCQHKLSNSIVLNYNDQEK